MSKVINSEDTFDRYWLREDIIPPDTINLGNNNALSYTCTCCFTTFVISGRF